MNKEDINASSDVAINSTNFPDENFREYVSRFDINNNGVLSDSEIQAVRYIYVKGSESNGIVTPFCQDLTGINYFTNLLLLECDHNNLTSLNVSNFPSLNELYCNNNNLTSLDLSNNGALHTLTWDNNFPGISLDNVDAFVRRLYLDALGRSSVENQGIWNWTNQIASKAETGGSAARFFCTCPEMVNRNLSNEE